MAENKDFSPETLAMIRAYDAELSNTNTKQKESTAAINEFIKVLGPGGVTKGLAGFSEGLTRVSGHLTNFTRMTNLSEGAIKTWAGGIATAVQGAGAFLDVMDRMEKLQGNLQRSFGLTNVSTHAFYENLAKGAEIGGTAGMKAMDDITRAMLEQRREGNLTDASFQKLSQTYTKFTLGLSANFPTDFVRMQQNLGMNADQITDSYEAMAFTAAKARIPFEQYKDAVFAVSEQFVGLGVTLPQVQGAFNLFTDDVSKETYTMKEAQEAVTNLIQAQKTAGGISQMGMLTHYLRQNFAQLPTTLQEKLGGEQFTKGSMVQGITAVQGLKPEDIVSAQASLIKILQSQFGTTGPAAMIVSETIAKMQLGQAQRFTGAAPPGTPDVVTTMKDVLPTDLKTWRDGIDKVADLNKEWYSFMTKWLQEAKGRLGDLGPVGKVVGTLTSGIIPGVIQAMVMRGALGGIGGLGGVSSMGAMLGSLGLITSIIGTTTALTILTLAIKDNINVNKQMKAFTATQSKTAAGAATRGVELIQLRDLMTTTGPFTHEQEVTRKAEMKKLTEDLFPEEKGVITGKAVGGLLRKKPEVTLDLVDKMLVEQQANLQKALTLNGTISIEAAPEFLVKISGDIAQKIRESGAVSKP